MNVKTVISSLGGPAAVGKLLGISSQAVSQWRVIPVHQALAIERATNGAVTREELRPDIFLRNSDLRPADPASSSRCSATLTPIREDEESHG